MVVVRTNATTHYLLLTTYGVRPYYLLPTTYYLLPTYSTMVEVHPDASAAVLRIAEHLLELCVDPLHLVDLKKVVRK